MQNRKLEIVLRLMPQVPVTRQHSVEQAMNTWWANLRSRGGMRLTAVGFDILHTVLAIESWELDFTHSTKVNFTKRIMLDLDRKLHWPYYLDVNMRRQRRHMIFFGSREAMMATMYGDLEAFLKQHC